MITILDNATLKIWFANTSTSRNLSNVTEIEHYVNKMRIKTNGRDVILNFNNVNLIEELEAK